MGELMSKVQAVMLAMMDLMQYLLVTVPTKVIAWVKTKV